MKRRIRRVVNFFAFNLLFFALYLNFIQKDNSNAAAAQVTPLIEKTNSVTDVAKKQQPAAEQKTVTATPAPAPIK
jgi:hypothetical protein